MTRPTPILIPWLSKQEGAIVHMVCIRANTGTTRRQSLTKTRPVPSICICQPCHGKARPEAQTLTLAVT